MKTTFALNNEKFIVNLTKLLNGLNKNNIHYNIVLTGGEPTLNNDLCLKILDRCKDLMPPFIPFDDIGSDIRESKYKLGINSNGDNTSVMFTHERLNYIDITCIEKIYNAKRYNDRQIVSLQTVLRDELAKKYFRGIGDFIDKAIDLNYKSIMIRQEVGTQRDIISIFELEQLMHEDIRYVYSKHYNCEYEFWIKYIYRNHNVYLKRQDMQLQKLYDRINEAQINSIVILPSGSIVKSWDHSNILQIDV